MTEYIICGAAELICAAALAWLLRTYVAAFALVKGNSMSPTLKNGDVTAARMCRGRKAALRRGDVVLCRYPGRGRKTFVKRIVGLPGDEVRRLAGVTMINGVSLDARANLLRGDYVYTLAEDEYFCAGDNRISSHDSRDWQRAGGNQVGPIKRDQILGVVKYVLWPWKARRRLDREFAFEGVQPVLAQPAEERNNDEEE